MEKFLVAGATGYVGRHVVAELKRRGYWVRALVRDRARAEQPGAHRAPALAGLVDEWHVGEVTQPETLAGVCDGVARVVSALGVTRQKAEPWEVDFLGNLRVLEAAEGAAVRSLCYVNVIHVRSGTSQLMRAKSAFVESLRRSRVAPQLVNPSGYFSDVSELVGLARLGVVPQLGDGSNRLNPIHGADLAAFCVDKALGPAGEWDVGGPDIMTYRELEELAFAAVEATPRVLRLPDPVTAASVWLADRAGPRTGSLVRFFAEGLTRDAVGQTVGTRHLSDWFDEVAHQR